MTDRHEQLASCLTFYTSHFGNSIPAHKSNGFSSQQVLLNTLLFFDHVPSSNSILCKKSERLLPRALIRPGFTSCATIDCRDEASFCGDDASLVCRPVKRPLSCLTVSFLQQSTSTRLRCQIALSKELSHFRAKPHSQSIHPTSSNRSRDIVTTALILFSANLCNPFPAISKLFLTARAIDTSCFDTNLHKQRCKATLVDCRKRFADQI